MSARELTDLAKEVAVNMAGRAEAEGPKFFPDEIDEIAKGALDDRGIQWTVEN
jgi:hypothetical protein